MPWAWWRSGQPLRRRPCPALLAAADRFDALQVSAQRRLRRMIVRHRALRAAGDACEEPAPPVEQDDGKILYAPHSAH
jgi:hypothetical protein